MGKQSGEENLGQYKIVARSGEGPVAQTYKAVDRTTGRKVMIRIVDPVVSRNEQIRGVLEDLRDPYNERRIQDPAVLRILDVGTRGEAYYIVYEEFNGAPLDEFLAEGRPTLREALQLARSIAEAVRAIHGHKVLHGDLKPQNVLVGKTRHGRMLVKVALADLANASASAMVSVYGELVGTPKYLSPEQIEGKRMSAASDIFSLGVIFYEMFSRKEPFPAGGPLGYLRANLEGELHPLSVADSALPTELSAIVDRMLDRDHRKRYRNVQSVVDDLERVEARLDGMAPEPAMPGSDSAFASLHRIGESRGAAWRAVAIVSLAAFAVLLTAVVLVLLVRPRFGGEVGWLDPGPESPGSIPATPPGRFGPPDGGGASQKGSGEVPPVDKAAEAEAAEEFAFTDAIRRADNLVRGGQYDDAASVLEQSRARSTGTRRERTFKDKIASVKFKKGKYLLANSQAEEAMAEFRAIRRDYKGTDWEASASAEAGRILAKRGTVLESQGKLKDAVARLEEAAEEFSETSAGREAARRLPDLRVRWGHALIGVDNDLAIETFRHVIAMVGATEDERSAARAGGARALTARAGGYLREDRLKECIDDCREARTMNPLALREVGKVESEALARLAVKHKNAGRPLEAVAVWRELEARYRGSPAHARTGQEVAHLLKVAETTGPVPMPAAGATMLMKLANNKIDEGGFEAGRALLQQILNEHPDSSEARETREILADRDLEQAHELVARGREEEAKRVLAKAAATYPASEAGKSAAEELRRQNAAPEGMTYVPPGAFVMGITEKQATDIATQLQIPKFMRRTLAPQQPARRVQLRDYYIDRHEVTNGDYLKFIESSRYAPPSSSAWEKDKVKAGYEDQPVTHVNWTDAVAYAVWAGKRLPTEEEWEKAARGPGALLFPWGNDFDAEGAVTAAGGATGTSPGGSRTKGRSPYGCHDMVGNVKEWTQSGYAPYPGATESTVEFDVTKKVARGGGWDETQALHLLCTSREALAPDARSLSLGFRCVKDVE